MSKTITRAVFTNDNDNDHHFYSLNFDPIEVERGTLNGRDWLVLDVAGHGFVANFYPNESTHDFHSVEGYFDTLEAARDYLRTLLTA